MDKGDSKKMEKVLVEMYKLTKAEAAALPNGTPFIVFNPEFRYRRVEISNQRSIAKSQYADYRLEYYVFDKPQAFAPTSD